MEKNLYAWHLIETLNIPMLPEKNIQYLREGADHLILPGSGEETQVDSCRIYIGLSSVQKAMEYIRDAFKSKEEFHQLSTEKTFLAAITVNEEGYYKPESLEIPYFSALLGHLNKKDAKIDYSVFEKYYDNLIKDLNLKFTNDLQKQTIGEKELNRIQSLLSKELQFPDALFTRNETGRILVNAIEKIDPDKPPLPLMNSFYTKDLEMILQKKQLPAALHQYITGTNQKTDIDENEEVLMHWLSPAKIPTARWPAPAHHKLSLMQQAAVNIAVSESSPLNSVNGPPGTGKTTLLKDIIASYYFERAKQMCSYAHPSNAFSAAEAPPELKNNGFQNRFYSLDDSLKKYAMVVASSNNGAVENISKELPQAEELMRNTSGEDDAKVQEREEEIKKLTEALQHFRSHADALLMPEDSSEIKPPYQSWGLFSAALGNKKNRTKFANTLWFSKINGVEKLKDLLRNNNPYNEKDWQQAKKEFTSLENQIEERKVLLDQSYQDLLSLQKLKQEKRELDHTLAAFERELHPLQQEAEVHQRRAEQLSAIIDSSPDQSWFWWMTASGREDHKQLQEQKRERAKAMKEQFQWEEKQQELRARVKETTRLLKPLQQQIAKIENTLLLLKQEGVSIPDEQFWQGSYEERQKSCPWIDDELNHLRSKAFIQAVRIHQIFLFLAAKEVCNNLGFYFNIGNFPSNHGVVSRAKKEAWQTLFLLTPIVSTTFASAGNLLKDFEEEEIGCLFIDEAGQAVPQAAAGAIFRSRNVVAVGDPLQIEPVVTMPESILHDIRRKFDVNPAICAPDTSIQTVADRGNPLGTSQKTGWIGIPLWVHRRCQRPMFDISNRIAYDNNMVLAAEGSSASSYWQDSTGKSIHYQYVEEHGKEVKALIQQLFQQEGTPADVFVITPFKAVAEEIKKELSESAAALGDPDSVKAWINKNIGTVHTFQGKEAKTVLFVAGTDEDQQGAAQWIVAKPNILNVAVTRAKKNFIFIGDHKRLKRMPYFEEASELLERK